MANPLYKVLDSNGGTYHGGRGNWPLPNGQPGEWLEVKGALSPCANGLHLCRKRDLVYWLGPAIFVAEHDGERVVAGDKVVVRKARLVSRVDMWNETTARLFAADCAERALNRERKAGQEPDPRSWAAVEAVRQYARGEIGDAAMDAAENAAWNAARAAAENAAENAAWAAARDAERRWQAKRLFEYLDGKRG